MWLDTAHRWSSAAMADVVQGNVQAAYQAYFDNMNPAPFAQIVREPPTPPCSVGRSSHSRRARARR